MGCKITLHTYFIMIDDDYLAPNSIKHEIELSETVEIQEPTIVQKSMIDKQEIVSDKQEIVSDKQEIVSDKQEMVAVEQETDILEQEIHNKEENTITSSSENDMSALELLNEVNACTVPELIFIDEDECFIGDCVTEFTFTHDDLSRLTAIMETDTEKKYKRIFTLLINHLLTLSDDYSSMIIRLLHYYDLAVSVKFLISFVNKGNKGCIEFFKKHVDRLNENIQNDTYVETICVKTYLLYFTFGNDIDMMVKCSRYYRKNFIKASDPSLVDQIRHDIMVKYGGSTNMLVQLRTSFVLDYLIESTDKQKAIEYFLRHISSNTINSMFDRHSIEELYTYRFYFENECIAGYYFPDIERIFESKFKEPILWYFRTISELRSHDDNMDEIDIQLDFICEKISKNIETILHNVVVTNSYNMFRKMYKYLSILIDDFENIFQVYGIKILLMCFDTETLDSCNLIKNKIKGTFMFNLKLLGFIRNNIDFEKIIELPDISQHITVLFATHDIQFVNFLGPEIWTIIFDKMKQNFSKKKIKHLNLKNILSLFVFTQCKNTNAKYQETIEFLKEQIDSERERTNSEKRSMKWHHLLFPAFCVFTDFLEPKITNIKPSKYAILLIKLDRLKRDIQWEPRLTWNVCSEISSFTATSSMRKTSGPRIVLRKRVLEHSSDYYECNFKFIMTHMHSCSTKSFKRMVELVAFFNCEPFIYNFMVEFVGSQHLHIMLGKCLQYSNTSNKNAQRKICSDIVRKICAREPELAESVKYWIFMIIHSQSLNLATFSNIIPYMNEYDVMSLLSENERSSVFKKLTNSIFSFGQMFCIKTMILKYNYKVPANLFESLPLVSNLQNFCANRFQYVIASACVELMPKQFTFTSANNDCDSIVFQVIKVLVQQITGKRITETCPICYVNTNNILLKCGHQFCFTCIGEVNKSVATCPLCGVKFDDCMVNKIIET
jgi:hypothetical protein